MPPHIPFPRPRPRLPRTRVYGGRIMPIYAEPQVIEVQRSEPALPWRVVSGIQLIFQSASMNDSLKFFQTANLKALGNQPLMLQRWTSNGWITEATRNAGQLGETPGVETGIFAIGIVVLLAAWITLS